MFISNIHGKESITSKAAGLGLKAGEVIGSRGGYSQPAIGGNTFSHKDSIKAAGARWNGEDKVWMFENWAALESAVDAIAAQ